jgi:CBS domain containing-hemolysin-like protein
VVTLLDAYAVAPPDRETTRVGEISAAAHLVPSVLPLDDLLAGLLRERVQLAVVLDEFGGLDGVVSLEDLLEELIGYVLDEHDQDQFSAHQADPGSPEDEWTLSGLLRPDEVRDLTGVEIPDGGAVYETLAGLVMAGMGRVPMVGDSVTVPPVELEVLAMDGRRVDQVRMARIQAVATAGEEVPS